MKERVYFVNMQLESGEWVNLVYTSAHRKNSILHWSDFMNAIWDKDVNLSGNSYNKWLPEFIYLFNSKNKDEECFDDYRTIDLRS